MTIEEKSKPLDRIGAGIRNRHNQAHTKNDMAGSINKSLCISGE